MGREVSELHRYAKYGSAFFDCLSLDLKAEFPEQTGFSSTNIKYTKRWYEFYNQGDKNRHQLGDDFKRQNLQQATEDFRQQLVDDSGMPVDFGQVPWKHHVYIFTHGRVVV